ncbi:hypothetical protein TNCV_3080471 [Trichonephila clavipes]|nr:hypothetical protein TNCV_3080471 [Trichonephila clavipes]
MWPNETVFQYLAAIRELENRGQGFLDETSIMEYSINGIPDSPSNKLILYGCTTIQEFMTKYFKIKAKIALLMIRRVIQTLPATAVMLKVHFITIDMIDIQNSMHQSLIQNLRIKILGIGIT